MNKRQKRYRRTRRIRAKINELGMVRLSVYRSNKHVYAQLIAPHDAKILAAASTLDKELCASLSNGSNCHAAAEVGRVIAKRAENLSIMKVAFDRSGYKYHGRIRALAEAARE